MADAHRFSVGDMAHLSPDLLKDRLGKNGVVLWQYANGLDDSPVCPDAELPPPKSVSKSVTLSHPLENKGECADILLYIAEELSYKLMDKGMNASVLTVAWKDPDYHYDGIVSALKSAASHMPRVDAVGVSSAGVYINDRTMSASLFLAVPADLYEAKVKDIYIRAIT